ncbi:hypothetical protein J4457_01335 [Candidatus Woesearchaeota archaeon]|nr:hypothetical protein [Candidatus Woesearchaeota archaeon]
MNENSIIPDTSTLFTPMRDIYGNRLALVFGNESKGGECPFFTAKQCYHCDIGTGEGTQFTPDMNEQRLKFFKRYYSAVPPTIDHLVIYNSGSTLNEREMSRGTLGMIVDYVASLQKCGIVSLDSREMFVTADALEYVVNKLRTDQQMRVILGIESQSDGIRMGKLNKKMTRKGIEGAFKVVSNYTERAGMDINVVFQPPELVGEEAIREAVETVRYSLDLAEKYSVSVDFNYHPFYQTKRSRAMYPGHPRANLEDAKKALVEMTKEIETKGGKSKIFIGWQDEQHDQEQHKREAELARELELFDQFNVKQDPSILK